jgi:peroxin-1
LLYVFCWYQVSLAGDASLEDVASLTEGFTGADLAAILTDAGLAAVHELLDNRENGVPESEPCISKELLMSVTRKARPSTPADDKRRYDREFGEFVSSRKSISTKVHLTSNLHHQTIDSCTGKNRESSSVSCYEIP